MYVDDDNKDISYLILKEGPEGQGPAVNRISRHCISEHFYIDLLWALYKLSESS